MLDKVEQIFVAIILALSVTALVVAAYGDESRRRNNARMDPNRSVFTAIDAGASGDAGAGQCYVVYGGTNGTTELTVFAIGCGNFPGISSGNPYSITLQQNPSNPGVTQTVSCTACTSPSVHVGTYGVELTCTTMAYEWNYDSRACVNGSTADGGVADAAAPDAAAADAAPSDAAYSDPPPLVLDGTSLPDVRFWFAPWLAAASWQEAGSAATELTNVTADGQAFGSYYDPVLGSAAYAASGRTGVSGTSGGRAYYEFSATGSNDNLLVQGSQDMFTSFTASRTGTLCMRVDPVADGTSVIWVDSISGSNTKRGIMVQRTTGNKIRAFVSSGSAFTCDHTTSASLLTSGSALTDVCVRWNAGSAEINVGDATEETFTCSGSDSSGSWNNELSIGGYTNSTGSSSGRIGELVIASQRWTDAQVTAWRATTTARTSTPLRYARSAGAGDWYYLNTWYDFRATASMFTDSACTTGVTTAGDNIKCVYDYRDSSNAYRRRATNSGASPATFGSTTNGIDFPGSTTEALAWQTTWPRGGAETIFVVMTCDDTSLVCRYLYASNSNYAVLTGPDYAGNDPPGVGYMMLHAGDAIGARTAFPTNQGGRNCLVIRRDGTTFLYGAGTTSTGTTSSDFRPVNIGQSATAGLEMDGLVRGLRLYTTAVPEDYWPTICSAMGL